MARKKMEESEKQQFQNVGLIKEDHDLLRKIAVRAKVHGPTAIGYDSKDYCRNGTGLIYFSNCSLTSPLTGAIFLPR